MGEITEAVISTLSEGVSRVLSEEFPYQQYRSTAEALLGEGRGLQAQAKILTGTQRVVHNAAQAAKRSFQLREIKSQLAQAFQQMVSEGIGSINADHGHTEDDELLALAEKLLGQNNEFTQKLADMFSRYYNKYLAKAEAARDAGFSPEQQAKIQNDILRFMQEGYKFLAHVGEDIRNTPILYEVTVEFGNGQHKTGVFTIDELMQGTTAEMHKGNFNLRLNNTGNLAMGQWSAELEKQYENFNKIETIKNSGWNKGERLEAFQEAITYAADGILNEELERALGASPKNIISLDDHGRHYLIHTKMDLSYMKGPDFFSKVDKVFDGLIFEGEADEARNEILERNARMANGTAYVAIQAKAAGATFTSLSSIIKSLERVVEIMGRIGNLPEGSAKGKINIGDLDADVIKGVEDLVREFLAV